MEKKAVSGSRKLKDSRAVTIDTECRASDRTAHKATPAPTAGKKRKKKKKAEANDAQRLTSCDVSDFPDHQKWSIVTERQSKSEFAAFWSPTPFYSLLCGPHNADSSSELSNGSSLIRIKPCSLLPSASTTPAGGSSSSSFESSKPAHKITRSA